MRRWKREYPTPAVIEVELRGLRGCLGRPCVIRRGRKVTYKKRRAMCLLQCKNLPFPWQNSIDVRAAMTDAAGLTSDQGNRRFSYLRELKAVAGRDLTSPERDPFAQNTTALARTLTFELVHGSPMLSPFQHSSHQSRIIPSRTYRRNSQAPSSCSLMIFDCMGLDS